MGRPARAWIRKGTNVFHGTIGERKVPLGVEGPWTPERQVQADAEYERLRRQFLAQGGVEIRGLSGSLEGGECATPPNMAHRVDVAVADFLESCPLRVQAGRMSPKCLENYRHQLARFCSDFGRRFLTELATPDGRAGVEAWAARQTYVKKGKAVPWSASYRRNVLGVIHEVFHRAGVAVKFDRPAGESRGAEVVLSDEQWEKVLANVYDGAAESKGDLREFLVVLRESGHRPAEVAALAVETMDWDNGVMILKQHKTARKIGKALPKVFNTAAMAVLQKQRAKYGAGLLFRTSRGTPWRKGTIVKQLLRVSERVGFRVIAYGRRHDFATNAIEAGAPEAAVAAILGHTSTAMVNKHYSHIGSRIGALKAAAELASRRTSGVRGTDI